MEDGKFAFRIFLTDYLPFRWILIFLNILIIMNLKIFKNVTINDQDFEIIIWEKASSNRSQLILSTIQTRSSSNSTLGNGWTERKVVDISRIFSTVEATGYGNLPVGQVKVSRLQVDEHSRINRKEKKKKLSETTVRQIVTKISA